MVNGVRAALLVLFGMGLALLPTAAPAADGLETPKQCLITTCVVSTVAPSPNGWNLNLKITMTADLGYKFFSLRVPGNGQMKVDGPGNVAEVDLPVSAGWDGNFQARACNADLLSERCDSWSTFHAELPVAAADQNFCIGYAGLATSAGTAALQQNCGFDQPPGRWSTDNAFHLNWCLGQFRGAGGVANKLVAARNLANSEEAARTGGLEACQANAAAAAADNKAYADQIADEIKVTGKTPEQCQVSNNSCEARFNARLGAYSGPALAAIATECAPRLQACLGLAAAYADQLENEMRVTGKTPEQCQISNNSCEARFRGSLEASSALGAIATECAPRLQACLSLAAAAPAAASTDNTAEAPPDDTADTSDNAADTPEPTNMARVKRAVSVHSNSRKGPVIGSLQAGTTVALLGCDNWACRIDFNGDEGFVARSFLDINSGGGGTSGGFTVEIPLPGKNKKVVITTPGLDLGKILKSDNKSAAAPTDIYDEPGGEGNVIGTLFPDDGPKPVQCRDDQWCRIPEGWVWGGDLN
jgi:hypothetical protein